MTSEAANTLQEILVVDQGNGVDSAAQLSLSSTYRCIYILYMCMCVFVYLCTEPLVQADIEQF